MIIKISQVLKNLKGADLEIAYPPQDVVNALPKLPDGKPDRSKLPRETVQSALLNVLGFYQPKDRKEVFKVYALAGKLLEAKGDVLEVEDALYKEVMAKALDFATTRERMMPVELDGGRKVLAPMDDGIYIHWAIAQLFEACGIVE